MVGSTIWMGRTGAATLTAASVGAFCSVFSFGPKIEMIN
jgi:hypothetical protein